MRKLSILAALLLAVGGACGDDDSTPTPDSSGMNPDSSGMNPDGSGMNPDGSGMNPDGSGMNPDGSGMTPDGSPGVACGPMTCTPGMECCVTSDMMMPPNPVFTCIAAGAMCMGASSACDGPEDCMGQRCCAEVGIGSVTAECRGGGSACMWVLCHGDADCAMEPMATHCRTVTLPGQSISACSPY